MVSLCWHIYLQNLCLRSSISPPDTHSVDGAEWYAEREIDIVPDVRWVAGPVDDGGGTGVGARQGPGDTRRSWWPEEEPCELSKTHCCRYGEVEVCVCVYVEDSIVEM